MNIILKRVFIFAILLGQVSCGSFAQVLTETPVEKFPQPDELFRRFDDHYVDYDDGQNWQFGTLEFTGENFYLKGISSTWINENTKVPYSLLHFACSEDGKRIMGTFHKIFGEQIRLDFFYETQSGVSILPSWLNCYELRYDLQSDGTERPAATLGFLNRTIEYIDGKYHLLAEKQFCYSRSYKTYNGKFFFQIETNPDGTQKITGLPSCPMEKWDAITKVVVGTHTQTFALVAWSKENGYAIWEYRNQTWQKTDMSQETEISRLFYVSKKDILCWEFQKNGEYFQCFRGVGKTMKMGPYRCFFGFSMSKDGTNWQVIAPQTLQEGEYATYFIRNGHADKIDYPEIQIVDMSDDGNHWVLLAKDKDGNSILEYDDRELWNTPLEMELHITNNSPLCFTAVAREGNHLHLLTLNEKTTLENVEGIVGISPDSRNIFCRREAENDGQQTYFICSNKGETWGPFLDSGLNWMFFSSDGKHWITIVQQAKDKKYRLLSDGKFVGRIYDNIIRVERCCYGLQHWHTYGLIDKQWYRISIDF